VAATRAAPSAIRVICQPGIPPATMVRTWTWGGTEAGVTYPAPGSGSTLAKAAGVGPAGARGSGRSAGPMGRFAVRTVAGRLACGESRCSAGSA